MKKNAFFIARRYLFNTDATHTTHHIGTMTKLSFLGIFTATFALALVGSIMIGFEQETHKKMQGIHASLIMQSPSNQPLHYEKIASILSQEFPAIESYSPYATAYFMVCSQTEQRPTQLVMIKGIIPKQEAQTTTLENTIVDFLEEKKLTTLLYDNHVLLGTTLATSLDVTIGDTITFLYAPDNQQTGRKIILEKATAIVAGTFKTGIEDFDANVCITSLTLLETLISADITHLGLKVKEHANQAELIQKLKKRFKLAVYSWKDLYPALVSALILEKYASILVLILIVLVASLMIVALLFMHITQKRSDIAILKAMGASTSFVSTIFMYMGLFIAGTAATAGTLCAFVVGFILKKYIPLELPDAYYVSHLPLCLDPWLFFCAWTTGVAISFLTTLYAIQTIKNINISHVLRFES